MPNLTYFTVFESNAISVARVEKRGSTNTLTSVVAFVHVGGWLSLFLLQGPAAIFARLCGAPAGLIYECNSFHTLAYCVCT